MTARHADAGAGPAALDGLWPRLCERHQALGPAGRWSVVWHGSMTRGVDDRLADVDLWCLGRARHVREVDAASPTRFFPFDHRGLDGHLNVEALEEFGARVSGCDLPLIAELRSARLVADPDGRAAALAARASLPMPEEVRAAWFRLHYVEYRREHRVMDNAGARGHPVAVLLAAASCLRQALQAAMVLDGQPYPYDKWLHPDALAAPTGAALAPGVEHLLDLVTGDSLRAAVPEASHPVVQVLKEMRHVLVGRARETGLDGEYLDRWWLHMTDAREGVRAVSWPG
jgi:Domain of unknown function (DUF4037)